VQRERGTRWRAEIEKAVPAIQLQTSFDQFQHVGMFAIAASIALLADNIARVYAHDKLGHGGQRQAHGREIAPGITFGKVLWAAANAARHYQGTPLHSGTEAVLDVFNITARDEQAAFLLLERAGVSDEGGLLRELNALCDSIDQAERAARVPQPGP
jgi:hypothetical protein